MTRARVARSIAPISEGLSTTTTTAAPLDVLREIREQPPEAICPVCGTCSALGSRCEDGIDAVAIGGDEWAEAWRPRARPPLPVAGGPGTILGTARHAALALGGSLSFGLVINGEHHGEWFLLLAVLVWVPLASLWVVPALRRQRHEAARDPVERTRGLPLVAPSGDPGAIGVVRRQAPGVVAYQLFSEPSELLLPIDGYTSGFELELPSGEIVAVPPGRARILGIGTRSTRLDRDATRAIVQWLGRGDRDLPMPAGAEWTDVRTGDRVEVLAQWREEVLPGDGYRSTKTRRVADGVPLIFPSSDRVAPSSD